MIICVYILFISLFLVFYNYAGYAIIVHLINKSIRNSKKRTNNGIIATDTTPSVSFIVAVFNEESCLKEKIINSLEQDYPPGKVEFIFITDGSTDRSVDIISHYPDVRLLHSPERKGKSAALNRAVQYALNDILIFSDANTLLNKAATRNIARHYSDARTGGVAGEKKVISASSNEVGAGEGFYWKYESFLKKIDSEFYSVVGAAGELFSVRRNLYEPVKENVILDDFIISLKVAAKGYRIIYEPEAYATELPSASIKDEEKRKIRIAAGGFQSIIMLKKLLLFWKSPRLSFLYISHRVLRWAVTPLCLIMAFISNLILFYLRIHPLFDLLLATQLLFYSLAMMAKLFPDSIGRMKLFKLSYYFVFMNISVIRGFFRFLRGKQTILWEKAQREVFPA